MTGPESSEDRTVPVDPDVTVPVPPVDKTVEIPRHRPPEQPWYVAYRRPGQSQPPPVRRPPPAMHTAPPPRHPAIPVAPVASQSPAPAKNTSRTVLIGLTVALFAVAGVLAAVLLRSLGGGGTTELDVTAAQQGVLEVLTDPINGYGRDDVSAVRCNNGRNPVVRHGTGFSCTANIGDTARRVAVVFTDDAGTYEVDRPR